MRTNTNCYVSCTGFRKGCYGLFRVYYVPLEWVATLSTRCIPWLEETLYPCTQLRVEEVPGPAGDGQAVADRYKRCGARVAERHSERSVKYRLLTAAARHAT